MCIRDRNTTAVNNKSTETTVNEEETVAEASTVSGKINFVINISSKKIHYADCSFVSRMNEDNRQSIQLTKDELNDYINNGYTLCSSCGG